MPITFSPNYRITPQITKNLMQIEACKEKVLHLPINPLVISMLRETAKLYTTHYSTMIERNRLKPSEIKMVLNNKEHFSGRQREEGES